MQSAREKATPRRHKQLHPVQIAGPGGKEKVYVEVTVDEDEKADKATLQEATEFVRSLDSHGRLAREFEELKPGATHQLERDAAGRKVVRRRRFSAI